MTEFVRAHAGVLKRRLAEPRRFIQVVAGPRQTGKTTLVRSVAASFGASFHYASADEPTLRERGWIAEQWETARFRTSEEDTRAKRPLKVVVLGSAPLLIQRGLTESLAGRFEVLRLPHWSYGEMREAFGFSLDQYLFYGGYPGAAPLIGAGATG